MVFQVSFAGKREGAKNTRSEHTESFSRFNGQNMKRQAQRLPTVMSERPIFGRVSFTSFGFTRLFMLYPMIRLSNCSFLCAQQFFSITIDIKLQMYGKGITQVAYQHGAQCVHKQKSMSL